MLNSRKRPPARGRRPGQPDTREAILSAARALFSAKGVLGTTVRAVAAKAKVDPSLIIHFFGSKDGLFTAALQPPVAPEQLHDLLQGSRSTLGERIVRLYVERVFRDREETIAALVRSATSDEGAATRLRWAIEHTLLAVLEQAIPGEDTRIKAEMVGSTMIGLFLARTILRLEPLASLSDDELVARYAPLIQRVLSPPRRRKP
jgi:AcrR family transcriptional regulator